VTSTQSQCCVDGTIKWEGRLATSVEREMYRGGEAPVKERARERELGGKTYERTERKTKGGD
jgi:hypothetical protein